MVSVTAKSSSNSRTESPATKTLIRAVVWPGTNVTFPDGNTPPVKSAAVTVLPAFASVFQVAVVVPVVAPDRVAVKLKALEAAFPSASTASIAAIDTNGGCGLVSTETE